MLGATKANTVEECEAEAHGVGGRCEHFKIEGGGAQGILAEACNARIDVRVA